MSIWANGDTYLTTEAIEAVLPSRLSEADLSKAFESVRPVPNSVILFGTSLEAQNGTGPSTLDAAATASALSGRGWWVWANAYLGQRLTLVRNAGVGGNTYAQLRTRIAADVLAYDSGWVIFGGPVNDVGQDRTLAAIQADLIAMLDAIGNGRQVVLLSSTPNTTQNATAARRTVMYGYNAWIRTLATSRPNVVVVDTFRAIVDPTTGDPGAGLTTDGTHYSDMGAMRVGSAVARVLDPIVPRRPNRFTTPLDPNCLIANPLLVGGTGWTLTTPAGRSVVYNPLPDRAGSEAAITMTGITDGTETYIQRVEPIGSGRYAPGDVIQLEARIRWSGIVPVGGTVKSCAPQLQVKQRNADSSFPPISSITAWQTASNEQQTIGTFPADGEMVLRTPRMTLGPNVANLYVYAGWVGAASGTVYVSDVAPLRNAA